MHPPDDKLQRRLRALAREAAAAPYWAYCIRDPLTGDRRDWTTGDPIHVGQTADPVRQAERHMVAATGTAASPLNQRLHQVVASGRIPVFELLEPAGTRLAALAAELRWAGRFAAEGFALLGARPEPAGTAGFGGTEVPEDRVWRLPLDELRADGIGLCIACEACGQEQALDLAAVIARSRPDLPAAQLRDAFACPSCGRTPCLALVPPAVPGG